MGHRLRRQWRARARSCPCRAARRAARLWECAPEFLKFFRIAQKLDQLLHFILGFLDAGDVAERDLVFVTGEHARLGFAEVERAFAGHADLLAEKKIENEEKERDREKTENGLGEQVRFGADGRLNAGSGKPLLEIGTEIQIDNGAELHRLFRAGGLFAIITDEGPGWLAFLNEQGDREVFVANDLLVIEELDKAVVGDILDILVTAVANEQSHADEAKGNGNKNDAAPVKVRLVIALVVALGIAVRLRHWFWCAEVPRWKKLHERIGNAISRSHAFGLVRQ